MPLGIDNVALASFMNLDDIIKVYNAPHHLRRPLLSANTERDSRWNLKWRGGLERAGASPEPLQILERLQTSPDKWDSRQ